MKSSLTRASVALCCALLIGCGTHSSDIPEKSTAPAIIFGPERQLGNSEKNPSTPFLRFSPEGRLFATWTEDHDTPWPNGQHQAGHKTRSSDRAPSPMRNAMLSWSLDGGKSWSAAQRINDKVEAIQGEENGPKIAFTRDNRAVVVWSIPSVKGDKTRANIRFTLEDSKVGFTAARTLNEVNDAGRFPVIEAMPDGNFLIAWIDRRIDNPKPRQLYLMKMDARGQALTQNYQVGQGLCECCKLGVNFADGGKTVYIVDREVDAKKIRNHVLRKSTDGGASFAAPVEISNDGWQVPSCPHSGPSIGSDRRGNLHVSWFTQGRSESDAGIYYSVSRDGGKTFAPRTMIHANTAPETLYNNLVVGNDDTVYFVWTNLDARNRAQVYMRTLAPDGQTWGAIQQISNAKGNANRPTLALKGNQLHVAWTEIDGEDSRVVFRSAAVGQ